jgi:HSP20 family protein
MSTRDPIDWMLSDAIGTLARAERLHQQFLRLRPLAGSREPSWEPPIDVLETETGLLIVVALPGVRRENMEVVIGNGELTVRGSRRWPALPRPARVHRIELPHGRFERHLPLPPGSYQLTGQDHTDGCLLLTLRRLD